MNGVCQYWIHHNTKRIYIMKKIITIIITALLFIPLAYAEDDYEYDYGDNYEYENYINPYDYSIEKHNIVRNIAPECQELARSLLVPIDTEFDHLVYAVDVRLSRKYGAPEHGSYDTEVVTRREFQSLIELYDLRTHIVYDVFACLLSYIYVIESNETW